MPPLFTSENSGTATVVGSRHEARKSHGVHYTPSELAAFVARRVVLQLGGRETVVLDPACGDGELLLAFALESARAGVPAPHLFGVDRDADALAVAQQRLQNAPAVALSLRCGDFLDLEDQPADQSVEYNAIISNPPYVRTQVLGAARAQALAQQFGLTGRVDLYHAFVAAMTGRLRPDGVLGLLCSNRFLTTKGGQSLRALLLKHYQLQELWDLGDTKQFQAAVLPAVLIGRRTDGRGGDSGEITYVRVNEEAGAPAATRSPSLLAALEGDIDGSVQVEHRRFKVERGHLSERAAEQPWRLTSTTGARWLAQVRKHSAGRLRDLGPIRVGIKTTADRVFIRESWDDLADACRPETELLHPLLTHRVAERWRATERLGDTRSVLYTHESRAGRRRAIDLSRFPRAAAYLEQHRDRLEGREYVLKAGRHWYEIWVPQQPDAWAAPKLVWPDISDVPRFFLDETGAIVNGDCYWLTCPARHAAEVALALAVANSSFALRYYDLRCGNRLYAGRRRFITQYLEDLPIPEASGTELREIVGLVETLRASAEPATTAHIAAEAQLDSAVADLFGLKEIARQPQL
jgi:adenine-specific DNA-methyltransferase